MASATEERDLLPTNVKPIHYTLELEPDLTTFITHGSVTIELDVLEDSSEIGIHLAEIEVLNVELKRGAQSLKPESSKYVRFIIGSSGSDQR